MLRVPTEQRVLDCRGKRLVLGERTLIMGILNVTPDSFSDGGKYTTVERAKRHAAQMAAEGADIIDIGGESTRPGHSPVSAEEELARILPVIEAVRREVDLPISVDTYKAEVARQALKAGAHIINDIWGFQRDPEMAKVIADFRAPVVLMHNRTNEDYGGGFMHDLLQDLLRSVDIARQAGVPDDCIILDPGFGFAKSMDQHLELMGRVAEVRALGFPVLIGTSRKRFIRYTLDVAVDDAVEGTAATVALAVAQGCDIVRVHDVKQMKRVAAMCDAVVRRPAATDG
jgi:dihydropteroate synthase